MFNIVRLSNSVPVEKVESSTGNSSSLMEYKTSDSQGNRQVDNQTEFGTPGKSNSFRPMDMVNVMSHRVSTLVKEQPKFVWFARTITVGTKVLQKFEQWKYRYPNTLGIPLGFVLRIF